MVLFCNGHVSDMEGAIEQIVGLSDIPISIIVIGIGDGDFSKLETLDADDGPLKGFNGGTQTRDAVQFVPFRKHKDND